MATKMSPAVAFDLPWVGKQDEICNLEDLLEIMEIELAVATHFSYISYCYLL